MKGKKAISAFMLINIFKFVMGAVVTILLLTAVWHFFGPKEKAEASTLKSMDDIIVKLSKIEEGQTVIAYGYVDKDAAIIGFNSDKQKVGEITRPEKCGARSNSCICSVKIEYGGFLKDIIKLKNVIKCKGFPNSRISAIKGSTDDKPNKYYQEKNGFDFLIVGGLGASFTSTMTLLENGLLSIESKITRPEP